MSLNRTQQLTALGQSLWYDYIRRDLYRGGELKRLIVEDGLRGMTSNPTIFEKAIADTAIYDDDIRREGAMGKSPSAVFEALAVADVCGAADVFRPVFDSTGGNDGFVSIEVAPQLALDTAGSIAEARRLWQACGRPNVMVKIPGTEPGIPAIRQCLAEGININITLLFSVQRHRAVMEAYLEALEERVGKGLPVAGIRSVASFFVSRVDTNVDKKLDAIAKDPARSDGDRDLARRTRGKVAIGNARIAYQAFEEVFGGARFAKLKEKGVAVQRPLWASTSAKDPAYPELYYVEALIAADSVDTVPPETFAAYKDHGDPQVRIHDDLAGARAAFQALADLGIDERRVSQELEEEGVRKFSDSFDKLLKAVEEKEAAVRAS
ncbi:MAG TPA: transaldolase [Thermoanaerobaculia bacterium]|nr:transaldolase [Thermoanaerobaculia bacterium]